MDEEIQHKNFSAEAWHKLSLAEQLGNVGSEYGRARNWRAKNNQAYFIKAADRALELMDLTLADSRWQYHRLKELARVREAVCQDLFSEPNEGNLESYFNQFAILARLGR